MFAIIYFGVTHFFTIVKIVKTTGNIFMFSVAGYKIIKYITK
jgi:hypothetical protein